MGEERGWTTRFGINIVVRYVLSPQINNLSPGPTPLSPEQRGRFWLGVGRVGMRRLRKGRLEGQVKARLPGSAKSQFVYLQRISGHIPRAAGK